MRNRSPHFSVLALLLILMVLIGNAPVGIRAQEPPPAAEPTATSAEEPTAEPQLPDGYTPPPQLAGLSASDLATLQYPSQTQGSVQLTVLVSPARFTAPQDLTYTFVYTNTSPAPASGIRLNATFSKWSKVAVGNPNPDRIWQYCLEGLCNPGAVSGPAVTRIQDLTSGSTVVGVVYGVGDLAGNQSGRFSVTMRVPNNVYPVSDKEPRRPAGSAQLFLNNTTSPVVSEASGAALAISPIFVIKKSRAGTNTKLYPLEEGEFIIRVQNLAREDAVPANNIVLTDLLPVTGDYVSSTPSAEQVTVGGKPALRWNLAGPINPGGEIELRVKLRRKDGPAPCAPLANGGNNLYATSDEMPLKIGSTTDRYTVASRETPNYVTQPPISVASVVANPTNIYFGSEAAITIKVRNYWAQPIVDGRLTYNVQPNATYRVGSATTDLISAPDGAPGGQVVWRLDMPAGSIGQPVEKSFSLSVRGGFSVVGNGSAIATPPAGIPAGCQVGLNGGVKLTPRISISKSSDVEKIDNRWYAREGDDFPYVLTIKNDGPDRIDDLAIVDYLPDETGADFSYNEDATLDDVAFAPIDFTNGSSGRIEWRNISVDPGQTRYLRYTLKVRGVEFQTYCNFLDRAEMEQLTGEGLRVVPGSACLRINPSFNLTKELVNPADANLLQTDIPAGGREVKFRVRITNNDTAAYNLALYDFLPAIFEFRRIENSTANQPPELNDRGHLEWALQSVGVGQSIEAVIVTNFNPPCAKQTYKNELGFKFRNNQSEELIYYSVPRTQVLIDYTCGTNKLEYSQAVDRTPASLGDEVTYTLSVSNKNTADPVRTVTVVDILPAGFTFVGMANSGAGAGTPQIDTSRSDGRIKLTWNVPEIRANATAQIRFLARTSNVVNQEYRNWLYATAPELLEATCRGKCETGTDAGREISFAYSLLEVRPLHTYTAKILAAGAVDECANPGDVRTYQLNLLNTNNHAYNSTIVTSTLPLGLHYTRPLEGPTPEVKPLDDGTTQLIWRGITVPKKPNDAGLAEYTIEVELEIGQVWGDQPTAVVADSPDGLIPRTDGEIDPTVKICLPDGPALAKDSSQLELRTIEAAPNQEFFYQIEVVNPSDQALTLTIEDDLPTNVTYVSRVSGPTPTRDGNKLRWTNLAVPAATSDGPGVARLLFKVKFTGGQPGTVFENTATVIESSQPVNTDFGKIGVEVEQQRLLYLPLINQ